MKTPVDFLNPLERLELSEFEGLKDKSRNDATYYAGRIKKLLDRGRARMSKERTNV